MKKYESDGNVKLLFHETVVNNVHQMMGYASEGFLKHRKPINRNSCSHYFTLRADKLFFGQGLRSSLLEKTVCNSIELKKYSRSRVFLNIIFEKPFHKSALDSKKTAIGFIYNTLTYT